jgi:hypothetical protein
MVAGQVVYIGTAGYFTVTSTPTGTSAVVRNSGAVGNATSGTIASGVEVTPGGVQGATGATGSTGGTGSTGATGASGLYQVLGVIATENTGFWTRVSSFVFDPSKTPGMTYLHAVLRTGSASVAAGVRLYDTVALAVISGSTLTTTSTQDVEVTSSSLTMGGTRRVYELQIQAASSAATIECGGAWLDYS